MNSLLFISNVKNDHQVSGETKLKSQKLGVFAPNIGPNIQAFSIQNLCRIGEVEQGHLNPIVITKVEQRPLTE